MPTLSFARESTSESLSGRIVVNGLAAGAAGNLSKEYLQALRKGGVHCISKSVEYGILLQDIGLIYRFVDKHADEVVLARSVADIVAARQLDKIAIVLNSQSGTAIEKLMDKRPMMFRGAMENSLRALYEMGLRSQGLCYNVANIFGGGCLEPDIPLTREGEHFVEEIHKLGIILDVGGHTGEQTSLDALAISKGVPVVCTHTNVASLNPNPRATSNRVFESIAKTGGVIGITAISDFHRRNAQVEAAHGPVSPQATLADHLDQYDYLKRLVSADHIGVGSDFAGLYTGPSNGPGYDSKNAITFPSYTLSNGPVRTVKNFEDISRLPNVERGLKERGWTQTEIDKVLGSNWLRVYKQVWGS